MATTAAIPEPPLRILEAMEGESQPRRRKRGRPKGKRAAGRRARRQNPPQPPASPVLNPAPNPSGTEAEGMISLTTSEPAAPAPERVASFDAAAAAVPEVIGDAPPVPGAPVAPGGASPAAVPDAEAEAIRRKCRAAAEEYVPKLFHYAAEWRGPHWELSDFSRELLVDEIAGALEELWPLLPDVFKNSQYPKIYSAVSALAVILAFKIAEDRMRAKKTAGTSAAAAPKEIPVAGRDGRAHATPMPASPASSASSGSPVAANPTEWGGSFTFAQG